MNTKERETFLRLVDAALVLARYEGAAMPPLLPSTREELVTRLEMLRAMPIEPSDDWIQDEKPDQTLRLLAFAHGQVHIVHFDTARGLWTDVGSGVEVRFGAWRHSPYPPINVGK